MRLDCGHLHKPKQGSYGSQKRIIIPLSVLSPLNRIPSIDDSVSLTDVIFVRSFNLLSNYFYSTDNLVISSCAIYQHNTNLTKLLVGIPTLRFHTVSVSLLSFLDYEGITFLTTWIDSYFLFPSRNITEHSIPFQSYLGLTQTCTLP